MVAYERDDAAICEELGCERIVFQTLDVITNTCSEVLRSEGLSEPQPFEVGVFCGQYATQVPPDYVNHLEELRGNRQPLEVSEAMPQVFA
jgi:amidophosphoribosyltransferase